ncbi:MAG: ribonuclease HI family protein [Candidatus Nanohaloarchaea archaeon]|nr:ribonuclease HI family protein [Candidatus Nanohaloarchaea archaeon]
MTDSKIAIYTDGASRGNPGPASYAYVIVRDNHVLHKTGNFLGKATNNQAEYHAVINALQEAIDRGIEQADLYSDSKLLVNQLNNEWQVKDQDLQQLHGQVQDLLDRIDVRFSHVPRENQYVDQADTLCNRVLDQEGH